MLDIWPAEVCACRVSFSSCLSSLGRAVGGQTLCRPQYRFLKLPLCGFVFILLQVFYEDSVIHTVTLPFIVGSDAIRFSLTGVERWGMGLLCISHLLSNNSLNLSVWFKALHCFTLLRGRLIRLIPIISKSTVASFGENSGSYLS